MCLFYLFQKYTDSTRGALNCRCVGMGTVSADDCLVFIQWPSSQGFDRCEGYKKLEHIHSEPAVYCRFHVIATNTTP